MKRIEALERELHADKMFVSRFWIAFLAWYLITQVSEYRSIFNSMNVELGWAVQAALVISGFMASWWLLLLPIAWVGWRSFEDRWLRFQSLRTLRLASFLAFAAAMGLHCLMNAPMLKLINNVG